MRVITHSPVTSSLFAVLPYDNDHTYLSVPYGFALFIRDVPSGQIPPHRWIGAGQAGTVRERGIKEG